MPQDRQRHLWSAQTILAVTRKAVESIECCAVEGKSRQRGEGLPRRDRALVRRGGARCGGAEVRTLVGQPSPGQPTRTHNRRDAGILQVRGTGTSCPVPVGLTASAGKRLSKALAHASMALLCQQGRVPGLQGMRRPAAACLRINAPSADFLPPSGAAQGTISRPCRNFPRFVAPSRLSNNCAFRLFGRWAPSEEASNWAQSQLHAVEARHTALASRRHSSRLDVQGGSTSGSE